MSYRIAVDEATEQASDCKGGFDFVVGRTGDLDACLRASWSDGPIAIWFLTVDALETFIRAWEQCIRHVTDGAKPRPGTLKAYADVFAITVNDLMPR